MLWSHIGTLMHSLDAEPRSTAGLSFPSRCPSGTILLTPCSMEWDWRVSRAGPILFYWPKLLYPYYSLLLFFPFILPIYRLVLWGWGFRTDRVYITFTALHCRPLLIIIIMKRCMSCKLIRIFHKSYLKIVSAIIIYPTLIL